MGLKFIRRLLGIRGKPQIEYEEKVVSLSEHITITNSLRVQLDVANEKVGQLQSKIQLLTTKNMQDSGYIINCYEGFARIAFFIEGITQKNISGATVAESEILKVCNVFLDKNPRPFDHQKLTETLRQSGHIQ